MYALFSGKETSLLRSAESVALEQLYSSVLDRYNKEQMLHAFLTNDPELPSAYHKVWRSYMAQKNRKDTDAKTKELMRQRILSMQKEKGVSNYRIYKTLGLNPGNINDWLKTASEKRSACLRQGKPLNMCKARYDIPTSALSEKCCFIDKIWLKPALWVNVPNGN